MAFAQTMQNDKMQWWREARFGMFIHWGLYSQCEGYWNDKPVEGIGEWIFKIGKIPVHDYHRLARSFKAENLDVESWVKLAKDAGMKYVVITTKHHDGFALFKSEADDFNVVDATPYGKDVIAQFVEACRKYDLKIGFYYSQFQDWSVPGAGGNDWEPGYEWTEPGFEKYMNEKALPQVREVLSNYGKIDMIWYDTPGKMTKVQSEKFLNLAKELQPDILVSGRVGNDAGDYVQMEDNNLPKRRQDFDWEVPVTMNHTWAYKRDDNHWKSTKYILWQLTHSVAMNGNYLLNIGPKADGTVPAPSINRLEEISHWMKDNKAAVEAAAPGPFKNELSWGSITQKPSRLYLNIVDYPDNGEIAVYGILNKIGKARLLKNGMELSTERRGDYLVVKLPKKMQDPLLTVVELEIEGSLRVDDTLVQTMDGRINLETELAKNTTGAKIRFGALTGYFRPKGELEWQFKITQPGTFKLEVITTGRKFMSRPEEPAAWDGGHEIVVGIDGKQITGIVQKDRVEKAPRDLYNDFKISDFGTVEINEKGLHTLSVKALSIKNKNKAGLAIRKVRLVPLN